MMTKKILKVLSLFFFTVGLLFSVWSLTGLNLYFRENSENRLPPAGEFINGPDEFSFAVVSDSGSREEPLDLIIGDIRKKDVKFVFHLGDQARDLSLNHFEYLLQFLAPRLGNIPFYAVPGNHDITKSGRTTDRSYKRAFGQMNYWFSYGNTLFVILNTANSDFDAAQQSWLKNVLARLRASFKNCIILMHVPPVDPRPGESYAMYKDVDELKAIISNSKIDAIIAGHIHEYNEGRFEGIPLYIAPPSGQKMRGKTLTYGYLLCKIGKDSKPEITKIDVTDKTGRDYFRYCLSSGLDGITAAVTAFTLLAAAFILLLLASRGNCRS